MSEIIDKIKAGVKYTYKGRAIISIKERGDTIMLTCLRKAGVKKIFVNKNCLNNEHFKEVKND